MKRIGFISAAVLIVSLSARADDEPEKWFFFCSDNSRNVGIIDARKSGRKFPRRRAASTHSACGFCLNDPQDPIAGEGYGQVSIE